MSNLIDPEQLRRMATEMVATGNQILEALKLVKANERILMVEPVPHGLSMSQPEQVQFIAAMVVRFYRFSQEQLKSRDRHEHIAWARQVYYWLCRKLTSATLEQVGDFVNRDHGTVCSGLEKVEDRRDTDKTARADTDTLLNDCASELKKRGVEL